MKLLRPFQAYKAGIVVLPSLFHGAGALGAHWGILLRIALAWVAASSLIYLFNDWVDAPSDRLNPHRANRPLAAGTVKPWEAGLLGAAVLACLVVLLLGAPRLVSAFILAYVGLNGAYTLGLKKLLGIRQAFVAVGFWLRLLSGAAPIIPIALTPWAALFTLGLAYFLACFKGFGDIPEERQGQRWAMAVGGGLAGALALVALTTVCLKRSSEGTMALPELPPLFCLVGLHRYLASTFESDHSLEQSSGIFRDPVILIVMGGFVGSFFLR